MIRTFILPFIYFLFLIPAFSNTENINIDTLVEESIKSNKYVLLFFHKEGCSFCEKMRESTLGNEAIVKIIEKQFVFVDIGINDPGNVIHCDFNGSKHEYAKSLEIGFYPTVGFVDSNNSIVYGAIGYQDSRSFSVLLEYIYGEHYKSLDLEEFRSNIDFDREDQ